MTPKSPHYIFYILLSFILPSFSQLDNFSLRNAVKATVLDFEETPTSLGPMPTWDTSDITDMFRLFDNSRRYFDFFTEDLSKWTVSSVTKMTYMFFGSYSFNSDLSQWDVSTVTEMRHMFQYAKIFNSNISNWNVRKVTDMGFMFHTAESFNHDLNQWNITNVNIMKQIFYDAQNFNQILCWDISKIRYNSDMFNNSHGVLDDYPGCLGENSDSMEKVNIINDNEQFHVKMY